jgi:mannose-6-phosphate isomerase-like protein (cupin superfamily)
VSDAGGVWSREEIDRLRAASGENYHEFVQIPAMSAGTYALAAGEDDLQTPHAEDEIYYVLAGRGRITIEADDHPVEPGDTIFVAAHADHRFHSIAEDLTLLVVFAPRHSG